MTHDDAAARRAVDGFVRRLPRPSRRIHTESLELTEPFVDMAARFAEERGTVCLLSGGPSDSARYHILGVRPWLSVRERSGHVTVDWEGGSASSSLEVFGMLEAILERYRLAGPGEPGPLEAGLLGYLAYDLKDCLERVPANSRDDLGLPRAYLTAPSLLVVHDQQDGSTTMHVPEFEDGAEGTRRRIDDFRGVLSQPRSARASRGYRMAEPVSCFSRDAYVDAIQAIREYILSGDVYQVNVAQRFETEFEGDAFALFVDMFADNPAAFFAYIQAGDHQIVSTSPERFLRLRDQEVETRPIKGTRPRGRSADEDRALEQALQCSPKDDAELSMIVDLMRNDLGKVCAAGSVHVAEHKRLEAYENVYHLVSIVRGMLAEEKNAVDLIRATFPGGSITGCPKIRAMEIIDELEPVRRHVYTGSIGYLGFRGNTDLSIAIRTAILTHGRLYFSVGGGVVFDSDANDEFEETLHKAKPLFEALHRVATSAPAEPWHTAHVGLARRVH